MQTMDTTAETIEDARRLLGEGKNRQAADLLTLAASTKLDPARASIIHTLALDGQAQAGRFGKRRWKQPLELAERQL